MNGLLEGVFVYMLECVDGVYYVGFYCGVDLDVCVVEYNFGYCKLVWIYQCCLVEFVWVEYFF